MPVRSGHHWHTVPLVLAVFSFLPFCVLMLSLMLVFSSFLPRTYFVFYGIIFWVRSVKLSCMARLISIIFDLLYVSRRLENGKKALSFFDYKFAQ